MNISTIRTRLLAEFLVPALLALGVVVPLFYEIVVLAPQQPDNLNTFYSFSSGLPGYFELKTAWRSRLFSNALASQADRLSAFIMSRIYIRYINRPEPFALATWTVAWLLLIYAVYIVFLRRRAVFYILGTHAAVSFGYMMKVPATRIYPWDMPALFIYVLFLFLFLRDKFKWILVLLPLGMGFKETAGILCIAFLLTDQLSKKEKWSLFSAALVLCVLVKLGIDVITRSASPIFTMETGLGGSFSDIYLINNLRSLQSLWPLLVNAGTLLSFFILPAADQRVSSLKWMAALFTVGNILFGTILEYRIWFELIPFSLYAIESAAYPEILQSKPESSAAG